MRNLSRTRKSNRYNRSKKKRTSKVRTSRRGRYSGGFSLFNLFRKKQNVKPNEPGIEMQTMGSTNPLKNNSRQTTTQQNNSKNNVITKTLTNTIFSPNNSSQPSIVPAPNNGASVNNDPIFNLPNSSSAPPYSTPSAPPYSPLPVYEEPYEPTDPTAIRNTEDPVALSYTPKPRRNRTNRSGRSNRSNRSNRRN